MKSECGLKEMKKQATWGSGDSMCKGPEVRTREEASVTAGEWLRERMAEDGRRQRGKERERERVCV